MTRPFFVIFLLCLACGLIGLVIGLTLDFDRKPEVRPAARVDYSALAAAERN